MNERLDYLREKTYLLTTAPGVYQMKDKTGHIIYIGKAKNLRNRVSSYFAKTPNHTPKVAKMVENVYDYDFIVTTSEYEALVLECSMIKQHTPKYNILLKDDKGYSYIRISPPPLWQSKRRQRSAVCSCSPPAKGSFPVTSARVGLALIITSSGAWACAWAIFPKRNMQR